MRNITAEAQNLIVRDELGAAIAVFNGLGNAEDLAEKIEVELARWRATY